MKRLVLLVTALCISLSIIPCFADNTLAANLDTRAQLQITLKSKAPGVKHLIAQVTRNRTIILKLKQEVKTAHDSAKKNIKKLLKNKDSLTTDQLLQLKDALILIKDSDQRLQQAKENLASNNKALGKAKELKNLEKIKEALKSILSDQEEQIKQLRQLVRDLNQISKI